MCIQPGDGEILFELVLVLMQKMWYTIG